MSRISADHSARARAGFTTKKVRGTSQVSVILKKSTATFATVAMIAVLFGQNYVSAGKAVASDNKVEICHATSSNSHPYVSNHPSKSADVSGHDGHDGPVWFDGIQESWGDIIPPFDFDDGSYPGKNWTTEGQAIWNNGCKGPDEQSPDTNFHFIKQICPSYGDIAGNGAADNEDATGGHFNEFSNAPGFPNPYAPKPITPAELTNENCDGASGWEFNLDDNSGMGTATTVSATDVNGDLDVAFEDLPDNVKSSLLGGGQMWVTEDLTEQTAAFGALRCYNDALNGDNLEFVSLGQDTSAWPDDVYCIAYNVEELPPNPNPCLSIPNDTLSAAVDEVSVAPNIIEIALEGKLILCKVMVGGTGDASQFSFIVDGGSPQNFEADGQNDLTLPIGGHDVAENVAALPSGWHLTSVQCHYENLNVGSQIPNGEHVVLVTDNPVICTFTNTFREVEPCQPTVNPFVSGTETKFEGYTNVEPSPLLDSTDYTSGTPGAAVAATPNGFWLNAGGTSPYNESPNAIWVSNTATGPGEDATQGDPTDDQWRLFTHSFNIPAGSTDLTGEIWYSADNAVSVYLDGTLVDSTGDVSGPAPDPQLMTNFQTVFHADFSGLLTTGNHTLQFVHRNWAHQDSTNPIGLIYRAEIGDCQPDGGNGPFTLTITTDNPSSEGEAAGVVTGTGINCDSNSDEDDCTETYPSGTVVNLTVDPDSGSSFDGSWATILGVPGTCTGNTTPCAVTMNGNVTLNAHFSIPTSSGGGGGGSRGSSGGGGSSGGQVSGDSIQAPPIVPQVLGATTAPSLPVTGFPLSAVALLLLSAAAISAIIEPKKSIEPKQN